MKMRMKIFSVIVTIFVIVLVSAMVLAAPDPSGPASMSRGADERRTADSLTGVRQDAGAGNVTSLNINSSLITKRWQGFYGNVSGEIMLDDADNYSLYSWQLASAQGEVYASSGSSVTWSNILCANFTASVTSGRALNYNLNQLNNFIGLGSDSEQAKEDSVNATFNMTYGDTDSGTSGETFQVGSVTINHAMNCSMANMFVNDQFQNQRFHEVILTDNSSVIWTALLEENQIGFDGTTTDFEMLVGVNGTDSANNMRPYYFFVELS
jgi:hypothetical protein